MFSPRSQGWAGRLRLASGVGGPLASGVWGGRAACVWGGGVGTLARQDAAKGSDRTSLRLPRGVAMDAWPGGALAWPWWGW